MVLWTTGQILPLQHTTSPKLDFNCFPSSFSLPTFLAETTIPRILRKIPNRKIPNPFNLEYTLLTDEEDINKTKSIHYGRTQSPLTQGKRIFPRTRPAIRYKDTKPTAHLIARG